MTRNNAVGNSGKVRLWTTPQLDEVRQEPVIAEPSLDELRQQAKAMGYDDGYAQGARQAQSELQQNMQTLGQLLDALSLPFAEQNQQVLDLLVSLAGKIARSLVKRELRTEPEAIMAIVRDTVGILNSAAPKINIYLNPADARLISQLTLNDAEKNRWELVDDPMVSAGDCKVGTGDSLVDGNLMSRINTIITQFQGDERG